MTAPLEAVPESTMPPAGTTAVFDDVAVTDSGVPSGSIAENANGPDDTAVPGSNNVTIGGHE